MDYSNLIEPDFITDEPYIFISYSTKDMEMVQNVIKILKDNHFRFWYDRGLESGVEWAEELGNKIDQCDQFLVMISSNSVKSKYVRKEIGMATSSDKNILVLYLEETNMTSGLRLLLGDIQAVHKEYFSNEGDFVRELCEAASNNTLYSSEDDFVREQCEAASDNTLYQVFDKADEAFCRIAKSELLLNYTLISQIGAGGISKVYLAEHRRTGALVAVKSGRIDKSYRGTVINELLHTEKKILNVGMQNMCPYIPIILDCYEDDTQIFLVETLVNGESLKSQISYSEEEIVTVLKKALNILRYLHGNNIIHRDIKPGNFIRDRYGELHLIDFNTAIMAGQNASQKGIRGGTVGFAPPEQFAADGSVNFSSDIYALGRTVEYLLCPEEFDRNARISIRYYRKDISVGLEAIVEKMTAASQSDRYQSVDELLYELERYKRTNVLRKGLLFIKSSKNMKAFEAINREKIEARKKALSEMAVASQSYEGEEFYDTIIQ